MYKLPYFFSVFLFLVLAPCVNAQYSTEWANRFNGTANNWDSGVDIAHDSHENVYVAGETFNSSDRRDILLIKYNSSGAQEWLRVYNSPSNGDEQPVAIEVDFEDNIIIAGIAEQAGSMMDYVILKYNPQGQLLWDEFYNEVPNSNDYLNGLTLDNAGNVYVTGSLKVSSGGYDMATLKYSSTGNLLWARKFSDTDSSLSESGNAITLDNLGSVIVTGAGEHTDHSTQRDHPTNIITAKYTSSGTEEWVRRNKTGYSGLSVAADADNNIYAGGVSFSAAQEMFMVKYSPAGAEQWIKIEFIAGRGAALTKLFIDDNNNVITCGYRELFNNTLDVVLFKYKASGESIWEKVFGEESKTEQPSSVTSDAAGNIYIGGYTTSQSSWDYLLVKYDSSGSFKWSKSYNGEGNENDYVSSVILTPSQNVIVTGFSMGLASNMDCVTISYSQITGISNVSGAIPGGYRLRQNYPNPFNPVTNITYEIKSPGLVSLTVHDVTGRTVAVLVNERQAPGTYKVDFNAANLSSGVYFYTLNAGEFTETRRMMIVK
jgi:uncharacterized delta-60 repeat protein